jgi:hypothetical protein
VTRPNTRTHSYLTYSIIYAAIESGNIMEPKSFAASSQKGRRWEADHDSLLDAGH